jgi:hypothetical protein
MAMREPEASGAAGGNEQQRTPDDHPVVVAIRNARMDHDPGSEEERLALKEWRAKPMGSMVPRSLQ